HPSPLSNLWLSFIALGIAVIFDGYSLSLAFKNINREKKIEQHESFFKCIKNSKDPTTLTVFFEDVLAITGVIIAAIAIVLVHFTGLLIFDAIASIVIGFLLMIFASYLAYEIKKLLIGEPITRLRRRKILETVNAIREVKEVLSLKTMHLSSEDVLVTMEINYKDDIVVDELEKVNDRIEKKIKEIIPNAQVYLEAENE
ncbi:cation diffusion facilitator family transporter, partial [Acidobacteriota bacterium]